MKLVESPDEYTIRTYRPGDETALVRLFNDENAALVGFVPRTVEYWRWCCFERPDVDKEGITIVEKAGQIVGYSVTGKSGNVWEFCHDSHYDAETIISNLLDRILDYSRSVGSNSVVLNVSTEDSSLRKLCQELGFAESPPEPTFVSVLDLPRLVQAILQSRNSRSEMTEVYWFCLRNCPPWCTPSFGVKVENKRVTILSGAPPISRIEIETEMSVLVDLMFGTKSVLRAMASSKIHFHPFSRMASVRKLLSLLQIRAPWFVPRADMG